MFFSAAPCQSDRNCTRPTHGAKLPKSHHGPLAWSNMSDMCMVCFKLGVPKDRKLWVCDLKFWVTPILLCKNEPKTQLEDHLTPLDTPTHPRPRQSHLQPARLKWRNLAQTEALLSLGHWWSPIGSGCPRNNDFGEIQFCWKPWVLLSKRVLYCKTCSQFSDKTYPKGFVWFCITYHHRRQQQQQQQQQQNQHQHQHQQHTTTTTTTTPPPRPPPLSCCCCCCNWNHNNHYHYRYDHTHVARSFSSSGTMLLGSSWAWSRALWDIMRPWCNTVFSAIKKIAHAYTILHHLTPFTPHMFNINMWGKMLAPRRFPRPVVSQASCLWATRSQPSPTRAPETLRGVTQAPWANLPNVMAQDGPRALMKSSLTVILQDNNQFWTLFLYVPPFLCIYVEFHCNSFLASLSICRS